MKVARNMKVIALVLAVLSFSRASASPLPPPTPPTPPPRPDLGGYCQGSLNTSKYDRLAKYNCDEWISYCAADEDCVDTDVAFTTHGALFSTERRTKCFDNGECARRAHWAKRLSIGWVIVGPLMVGLGCAFGKGIMEAFMLCQKLDTLSAKKKGKKAMLQYEAAYVKSHPITVTTLAGNAYVIDDWGSCADLRQQLAAVAPELGDPLTFALFYSTAAAASSAADDDGGYVAGWNDNENSDITTCKLVELRNAVLNTPRLNSKHCDNDCGVNLDDYSVPMFDEALAEIQRRTAIAGRRMQGGRQPGDDAVVQVEQDNDDDAAAAAAAAAPTMVQLPFDPMHGSADRTMLFDGEVTELVCLYETRPSTTTPTLSARAITTAWNGNSMELTTTSSSVERPQRFVSKSSTV